MVNSFSKSLMYRAAPRWSSAFMRSQPNKSTGPKRGTPTRSRGQRNATRLEFRLFEIMNYEV
jgi:hypothetical protein